MAEIIKRSRFWIFTNIAGLALYVFLSAWTCGADVAISGVRFGVLGSAFGNLMLGVWYLGLLFNAIWLIVICACIRRPNSWVSIPLLILVLILWGMINRYDTYRWNLAVEEASKY